MVKTSRAYPLSPYDKGFAVDIGSFLNGYFADSFVSVFFVEFFSLEGIYIASKELQINEEIRDAEVRVISDSGEQLGIMSGKEAYNVAVDKGLDLVKISPNAQPPVCKIMDYGKYKFELAKREKENRKNQKVVNTKEVQLSPSIDTNDFNTKCNHAIRFLKNGDKVKVSVRFRGREISHSEMGESTLEEIDKVQFDCAVNSILKAKNIYITGVRSASALASFTDFYLRLMFENTKLIRSSDPADMFEQTMHICENDVIIGMSFPRYSKNIIKLLKYAAKKGATIIGITDSPASPIARISDYALTAKTDMNSFVDSLAAPLSVVNALIAALGMKQKEKISQTFESLENIWDEYEVYDKE